MEETIDYLEMLEQAQRELERARLARATHNLALAYENVRTAAQLLHDYQLAYEADNNVKP